MLVLVFEKPHGLDAQHENAEVRIGYDPPVKSEHFLKHSPSWLSMSSGHGLPSPTFSLGAKGLFAGSSVVVSDVPAAGTAGGAGVAGTAGVAAAGGVT